MNKTDNSSRGEAYFLVHFRSFSGLLQGGIYSFLKTVIQFSRTRRMFSTISFYDCFTPHSTDSGFAEELCFKKISRRTSRIVAIFSQNSAQVLSGFAVYLTFEISRFPREPSRTEINEDYQRLSHHFLLSLDFHFCPSQCSLENA